MFNKHDEIIYPYIDDVRKYLEAGADAVVDEFNYRHRLQSHGITVSWTVKENDEGGTLEIADNENYENAKTVKILPGQDSYTLQFVLRDTKYFLRLKQGNETYETSFSTPYLGPRFLNLGGLYFNGRDLGGYKAFGTKTLYNKIIRGSTADNCQDPQAYHMTEEGTDFLMNVVGIKTQLDFRGAGENANRTESSFKNVKYVHMPVAAYMSCFTAGQAEIYRDVFRLFADPDNYPIYMHCVGGADRTGTVAALLLALLGVSRDEIIQDYVVTTFTPVCEFQGTRNKDVIGPVIDNLNIFGGDSLAEKCASFLASIGVTKREIYNIRAIMLGLDINAYVPQNDYGIASVSLFYDTSSGKNLLLFLNGELPVSQVSIDGRITGFKQEGTTITIPGDELKSLSTGEQKCEIVFESGNRTPFVLNVNCVDLTGELQVVGTSKNGEYTYVDVMTKKPVFMGVGHHFHTHREDRFPSVENHIKLNGRTIEDINANEDVSSLVFAQSPGKNDPRQRVPVTFSAQANKMTLIIKDEWLGKYLNGKPLEIAVNNGFEFTSDGIRYRVLGDVKYVETAGGWMRTK